MKQVKRLLLIFSLFFCVGIPCWSQNADSLSVEFLSAQYPQCPDTAFLNSSYQGISVVVRNHDSTSVFNGQLQINFKTSNDTLSTDSVPINNGTAITIAPNDSGIFFFPSSYVFTSNVYRLGSSVVVVWPVSTSSTLKVIDSLFVCLNLQLTNNLHDPYLYNESVYPNPAFNILNLNPSIEKITESVRIYDATGRMVYDEKMQGSTIPVEFLNPGMYILEIVAKNSQRFRKQFLKE